MLRSTVQYAAGLSVWTAAAVAASEILRLARPLELQGRPAVRDAISSTTSRCSSTPSWPAATFVIGAVVFLCTWRVRAQPHPGAAAGGPRSRPAGGFDRPRRDARSTCCRRRKTARWFIRWRCCRCFPRRWPSRRWMFAVPSVAGVGGLVVVLLPAMTEDELQAALERTTPERDRYELFVEEAQDQDVRIRFSPPAEGWSTAALLAVVDTALRGAAGVEATVTHLNVTRAARGAGRRRDRVVARDPARPRYRPCRVPGCSATPSSRRCCTPPPLCGLLWCLMFFRTASVPLAHDL